MASTRRSTWSLPRCRCCSKERCDARDAIARLRRDLHVAGFGRRRRPSAVPDSAPARRQALEQRFRQRMAAVVQQRLNLNADQMRRLGDLNREMETQRRQLNEQERAARVGTSRTGDTR